MDTLENILKITKDYYHKRGDSYQVFPKGNEFRYWKLSDYVVSSVLSGPSLWLIPRKS